MRSFFPNSMTGLPMAVLLAALVSPPGSFAQDVVGGDAVNEQTNSVEDFDLFEPVDINGDPEQVISRRRGGQAPGESSEPEFTLVGTTRIGSKYSAILRNRNGTEVVVNTSPETNTRIDGFTEYAVVNVEAGKVSIKYPDSSTCIDNAPRGVSCNVAANIASLALTNGAPLPRELSQRNSARGSARNVDDPDEAAAGDNPEDSDAENDDADIVASDEPEEPVNPFAALRARAQGNSIEGQLAPGRASSRQGFTPRRIDPAEVPPGMRVVSTPFGDRLVEE